MRRADELRDAVEAYLGALAFAPELGALEEPIRYSLESGGKRIRPLLCLAVAEAAGGSVDDALPAAASIELVHTFSLIHDDLPALDDDVERRGRESTWVAFGEGVALLAGDALLAEAFRLAHSYESPAVAHELVGATLGMIGGQYRDITGDDADLEELHRLKTGRLFVAAVLMGLDVAAAPAAERTAWLAFGEAVGLLFQVVDDVLDGDGYAERLGRERAERLAEETAARAHLHLDAVDAETAVLRELVDVLAVRTG
jgi:geranylgeranyl diphosphate synthase type II